MEDKHISLYFPVLMTAFAASGELSVLDFREHYCYEQQYSTIIGTKQREHTSKKEVLVILTLLNVAPIGTAKITFYLSLKRKGTLDYIYIVM